MAQAARECGLSWLVAQAAFAAADPVLEQPLSPVAHLESDEHGRGRPCWQADEDSGEYVLLADRWHTCFFDLSGDQRLLGQVEGRSADDAAYWLAQASPAWRNHIQIVAIDMCSIYASAVRRKLPHATLVVDLFHVVQLAVKMTGDVRRRVVRGKLSRSSGHLATRSFTLPVAADVPDDDAPASTAGRTHTPAARPGVCADRKPDGPGNHWGLPDYRICEQPAGPRSCGACPGTMIDVPRVRLVPKDLS